MRKPKMNRKPRIAIAMGDPAGIGPEIICKLVAESDWRGRCRLVVIGAIDVLRSTADWLRLPLAFAAVDDIADALLSGDAIPVLRPPGFQLDSPPPPQVNRISGEAAAVYLRHAYELAMQEAVDGVVMAPMNKESFRLAGYDYLDELAFLADITDSREPFILGAAGPIWAVAVTEHIAFADIPRFIKRDRVLRFIRHMDAILTRLGYEGPRIAIAALNPHAGEGGLFGREEIDEIGPAVMDARRDDIQATGPVPADIVFKRALDGDFDGVVFMYHDQMNIARKLQERGDIATLWMGLPVIGATTAHGTAFDIAGKGIADPGSLRAALEYAIKLA